MKYKYDDDWGVTRRKTTTLRIWDPGLMGGNNKLVDVIVQFVFGVLCQEVGFAGAVELAQERDLLCQLNDPVCLLVEFLKRTKLV